MKKILFLFAFLSAQAHAATVTLISHSTQTVQVATISVPLGRIDTLYTQNIITTGPAGPFILNQTTNQPGAAFNISSGTAGRFYSSNGSLALPSYTSASDTGSGIRFPIANSVSMVAAGIDRVFVDSNGNVFLDPTNHLCVDCDNEKDTNPGYRSVQFGTGSGIYGSTQGYIVGQLIQETCYANNGYADSNAVTRYINDGFMQWYCQSTGGDHNFYTDPLGTAGSIPDNPANPNEPSLRASIRNNGQFELNKSTNQIRFGITGGFQTTLNVATPTAQGITVTVPNVNTNANFVMSAGTQAIAGPLTQSAVPSFLASLSTVAANVTGNGQTYTVVFNNEISDKAGNFDPATGIFTAQITGHYSFGAQIALTGMSSLTNQFELRVVTTGRTFATFESGVTLGTTTDLTYSVTVPSVPMTAGDTARVNIIATGGTQTTDLGCGATLYCFFSGNLEN